jgi:hypothetical protein
MTVKAPEQEIHPMIQITRSARRTADPRLHAAVAMLPDTMRHIGGDHLGRWEGTASYTAAAGARHFVRPRFWPRHGPSAATAARR